MNKFQNMVNLVKSILELDKMTPIEMTPIEMFRHAIRERDEKIERAAIKSALEAAAKQKSLDKLISFLESIGDFVILDAGGPNDELQAVLTPIKELWIKSDGDILLLGNRGRDPFQLSLVNGFDENVKKIIEWMVENGAREPEASLAG